MPTISSPLCMTWLTFSIRLNCKTMVYTPQEYLITNHPITENLLKGHTHVHLKTRTHTKLKLAQNKTCQIHFRWLEQTATNQKKHCSWQPPPMTCQHCAVLHQANCYLFIVKVIFIFILFKLLIVEVHTEDVLCLLQSPATEREIKRIKYISLHTDATQVD